MRRAIVDLVYRLGFRPKFGTIFYSPSKDFLIKSNLAIEVFMRVYNEQRRVMGFMNNCIICNKPDSEKPMAFRATLWCSENHRKRVQGDEPVKKY